LTGAASREARPSNHNNKREKKNMTINALSLASLFQTFKTLFGEAMKNATTRAYANQLIITEIAMEMVVSGAATVHGWMNQVPGMKEWIGERELNNISLGKVTATNRDFESTIAVPRNDIEDDQYGVFSPLMAAMGAAAQELWMELGMSALLANGSWADGNPFFCTGRVLNADKGVTITNAATTALSKAAVETGLSTMRGWMLHGGQPAKVTPRFLVVGPSLEATAKQIVEAQIITDGTVGVSNTSPAMSLQVRVDPTLVGAYAAYWFITGEKAGIKPVCVQKRKLPVFTAMTKDTDENVFMRKEFLYGTDARGEAFLTLPFLAYRGGVAPAAWAEVA
jgi:phage major head subunit gpT-like protein